VFSETDSSGKQTCFSNHLMVPSDFCSELMFIVPGKVLLQCQGDGFRTGRNNICVPYFNLIVVFVVYKCQKQCLVQSA